MKGYTVKDVAKMLDLTESQVRQLADAGFLDPGRGPRGELRFSFQDLVLLRTAKELRAASVPLRRVNASLRRLRGELPEGRPLSAVQIQAHGERLVIREGDALWDAESGQGTFDFEVAELAEKAAPRAPGILRAARLEEENLGGDDWFELGLDLEATAPQQAREAYERAVESSPRHIEARINLGRLLLLAGERNLAEAHLRIALSYAPDNATAHYDLGVALEDLGRTDEAREAYLGAIAVDPEYADAYFNLARLFERGGDDKTALRHLKTYRKLTDSP